MDRGAWWAAVHGVAESQTRLSDFTSLTSYFITGEGNGNPLQCSCLENPRDGGAWWAAVYGVAQSQTQLKWLSSSSGRWCDSMLLGSRALGLVLGRSECADFSTLPGNSRGKWRGPLSTGKEVRDPPLQVGLRAQASKAAAFGTSQPVMLLLSLGTWGHGWWQAHLQDLCDSFFIPGPELAGRYHLAMSFLCVQSYCLNSLNFTTASTSVFSYHGILIVLMSSGLYRLNKMNIAKGSAEHPTHKRH